MEPENIFVVKQSSRKRLLLESAKNFAASSALQSIDFTQTNIDNDISINEQVSHAIILPKRPKNIE